MTPHPNDTLDRLRKRIRDTAYVVPALEIAVTDTAATVGDLELYRGRIALVVAGGTARGFDLPLTDVDMATVGGMARTLSRFTGVLATLRRDTDADHQSIDLEPFGPSSCLRQGVTLLHRVFSDWELEQVLLSAIGRHNPGYGRVEDVPAVEVELVLHLAEAQVLRRKAGDAAKRRGTDPDSGTLLRLAESLDGRDGAYEADRRRLRNVMAKAPEAPAGTVGTGDIMLATRWRKSLRNGYKTPRAVGEVPPPPVLLDPMDGDAEDTNVLVRWNASHDIHFHSYELWKDTIPEVEPQTQPVERGTFQDVSGVPRLTTSSLAFRAVGPNSAYGTARGGVGGQGVSRIEVAKLEPDTDYFFRLRTVTINAEAGLSNVVRIRTRRMRVKFHPTTWISLVTAAIGATLTLTFDSTAGAPNASTKLWVGGKLTTLTLTGAYTGTFVVPTFVQLEEAKDVVIEDEQGLKDVHLRALTVTA